MEDLIGTPITGREVIDAVIPGRCAAPPAPAIITFKPLDGWDSILSILQMPNGIPVATVALNAAKNAGILAARIIGSFDKSIQEKLDAYALKMKETVIQSGENL